MRTVVINSPIGRLGLSAEDDQLVGVQFRAPGDAGQPSGVLAEAASQLEAYFGGRLRTFDLPLAPAGTDFQRLVWTTLCTIPYGATWSYSDLADHIGKPSAVRAVGAANGRNPIPVIIPCHRVIGRDGRLVGFGGGLETKRALLALEQGSLF